MAELAPIPTAHPRIPVWATNLAIAILVAALWPLNWLFDEYLDPYYLLILINIGISIILATSLNLINGITGQFSLGHAGFMGLGAYTAGVLLKHFFTAASVGQFGPTFCFVAVLILSGVVAAGAGLIVGIPVLRLRGDYLAIATLGFGEIIYNLIITRDTIGPFYVGGASGLHGIPQFNNFFWTYLFVVLCVVCMWRLVYSAKGKAFLAIREDEIAAGAMGINTTFYKVAAFVIGAFFAGIAGGLVATLQGSIVADSFGFMKSTEIVVMVVLGGSGSITGVILAAAVLTYLPEGLREVRDWRMIIYSLLLILMMLLRPQGLLGSREVWWTRRRRLPTATAGRGFEVVAPTDQPS
jgi:branched-chain amino acid transport system permease protein